MNADRPDAPGGGKHARPKTESPRGGVPGWPDVLRVLQHDESRSRALGRYRAGGFSPDDFVTRPVAARLAMADALTRVEDWLEVSRGDRALESRAAIQAVRRRQEGA